MCLILCHAHSIEIMLVQIIAIFKYVLDCWDFESIGDYKLERTVDMKNITLELSCVGQQICTHVRLSDLLDENRLLFRPNLDKMP